MKTLPGVDNRVIPLQLLQSLRLPFLGSFTIIPFLQASGTSCSCQMLLNSSTTNPCKPCKILQSHYMWIHIELALQHGVNTYIYYWTTTVLEMQFTYLSTTACVMRLLMKQKVTLYERSHYPMLQYILRLLVPQNLKHCMTNETRLWHILMQTSKINIRQTE